MNRGLFAVSTGAGPDLVLLHGLFGQGGNLRGIARALERSFRVHTLDLPDHGRSAWLESASLSAYAAAVADWLDAQQLSSVMLLGHSLGGKVAMALALSEPKRVSKLVVADMAPVSYPRRHDGVLDALAEVTKLNPASKTEAQGILAGYVEDPAVAAYLAMSWQPGEGAGWKFNLAGLAKGYQALGEAPGGWCTYEGEALFIRGADSDYVRREHEAVIFERFPRAQLETLEGAGHWLHRDQPDAFLAKVGAFLGG